MESTHRDIVRHPIRGGIYGLLLGIGVAVYLVLFSVVRFGEWLPAILVVLLFVGFGVAWAYLAPPKQPKGPPPQSTTTTYPQ